ncbi:hypothetical protein RN001_013002 [Aquatica leii]|uniref:Uncharacterized protein n=1 Tax=Aquatica leii TaxID=1421715 RepID=A0AAN7NZD6_9COLE|nr:hypothetical protein RN001_013002 [Aquatica leii]
MQKILKFVYIFALVTIVTANTKYHGNIDDVQAEAATRLERQAGGHHHDAVDFGAHTGHKGSFGWHADFPVHSNH